MKLLEIGAQISEDDILKLEATLGITFPQEYKSFLLQNNGGMPEDDVEYDFIETNPATGEKHDQGSDIQYFYNTEELTQAYESLTCEELIPASYIPIACDSFGNDILLSTAPNDVGHVCFANHEAEHPDSPFSVISEVADSFSEFLSMLRPMEL